MTSLKRKIRLLRIFDCSNSTERPTNRSFGGPVQNEFVGLLHKHSERYGIVFVDSLNDCDLVFTNDVYPESVLTSDKPRVKRMDGIFWLNELKDRNEKYNLAAKQSDLVIFISEYSKNSFETLYGSKLEKSVVVTHWVEKKFDYFHSGEFNNTFFAMATDWKRKEKRFGELVKFSKLTDCKINLVGTCNFDVPKNIIKFGYLESDSDEFLNVLKDSSAFLNLTCKDAATKTVCLAINYGLPILFSTSGGVGELVGNCGIGIKEKDEIDFLDSVPQVDEEEMINGLFEFKNNYDELKRNIMNKLRINPLRNSIEKYFREIKSVQRRIK
jgi:glycosyltransferase involved in cell wall biosynthesis